jgi:hypothetical protein
MPNVIDIQPMQAMTRKIAAALKKNELIAARFQKLAFDWLLRAPGNFRPALASEILNGPLWAHAVYAQGEIVSVFQPLRNASLRLRTVARRLADTCEIAEGPLSGDPSHDAPVLEARRFLAKFDRVNFDTAARKALRFSRLYEQMQADRDAAELCPPQTVAASEGAFWERLTSIAGVRKVGREFNNCLASSTRSSSYVALLRRGAAQFWVLRDIDGAGLIVAMATTGKDPCFSEVKGPRNVSVNRDHPDLCLLAAALGLRPREPAPRPSDIDFLRRGCIAASAPDASARRLDFALALLEQGALIERHALALFAPAQPRVRRRTSS